MYIPAYSLCRNGVLKAGDRIKKINGVDTSRYSQMETLSLLKSCGETCLLSIEYDTMLHDELTEELGPLQVDLLKPKGASLGIKLRPSPPSPHNPSSGGGRPLVISRVKEAGIADRWAGLLSVLVCGCVVLVVCMCILYTVYIGVCVCFGSRK